MGSDTFLSLSKILTLLIFLFFVVFQADCLGVRDQKMARLTTFGNNAIPNKPTTTTQAPTGKECRSDQECTFVHNATCKKDPHDQKMRCLCPDKSAPKSASCKHSRIGLHSRCDTTAECIDNAVCKIPSNSTNSNNPNYKACLCKDGYEEEDHECNRGILTSVPGIFLLITFSLLQLTKY